MKKYMIITLLCAQSVALVCMDRAVKAVAIHRKSAEKTSKKTESVPLSKSTEIPVPSRKSPSLSPRCSTPVEKYSPNVYWTDQFCCLNEVADSPKDLYFIR